MFSSGHLQSVCVLFTSLPCFHLPSCFPSVISEVAGCKQCSQVVTPTTVASCVTCTTCLNHIAALTCTLHEQTGDHCDVFSESTERGTVFVNVMLARAGSHQQALLQALLSNQSKLTSLSQMRQSYCPAGVPKKVPGLSLGPAQKPHQRHPPTLAVPCMTN